MTQSTVWKNDIVKRLVDVENELIRHEKSPKKKGSSSSRSYEVRQELKEAELIMNRGFQTARQLSKQFESHQLKPKVATNSKTSVGLQVQIKDDISNLGNIEKVPQVVKVCHKCIMTSPRKERHYNKNTKVVILQSDYVEPQTAKHNLVIQQLPSLVIKGELTREILPNVDIIPGYVNKPNANYLRVLKHLPLDSVNTASYCNEKSLQTVDVCVQTDMEKLEDLTNTIKAARRKLLSVDVKNLKKQINENWKFLDGTTVNSKLSNVEIRDDPKSKDIDSLTTEAEYESDFEAESNNSMIKSSSLKSFDNSINKSVINSVEPIQLLSPSEILNSNKKQLSTSSVTSPSPVFSPSKERFYNAVRKSKELSLNSGSSRRGQSDQLKVVVPNIVVQLPEVDSSHKETTLAVIELIKKHFEKTECLLDRLTEQQKSTNSSPVKSATSDGVNTNLSSKLNKLPIATLVQLPPAKSMMNLNVLHKRSQTKLANSNNATILYSSSENTVWRAAWSQASQVGQPTAVPSSGPSNIDPQTLIYANCQQLYGAPIPATLDSSKYTPLQLQQWQQWQEKYQQWQQLYGQRYAELSQVQNVGKPAPVPFMPPLPVGEALPPMPDSQEPPPPPPPATEEQISDAEKSFDIEFMKWEKEFESWKQQHINHPDKNQYMEYEKKWLAWRETLLERRDTMRKKRMEANVNPTLKLNSSSLEPLIPPMPCNSGLNQPTTNPLFKKQPISFSNQNATQNKQPNSPNKSGFQLQDNKSQHEGSSWNQDKTVREDEDFSIYPRGGNQKKYRQKKNQRNSNCNFNDKGNSPNERNFGENIVGSQIQRNSGSLNNQNFKENRSDSQLDHQIISGSRDFPNNFVATQEDSPSNTNFRGPSKNQNFLNNDFISNNLQFQGNRIQHPSPNQNFSNSRNEFAPNVILSQPNQRFSAPRNDFTPNNKNLTGGRNEAFPDKNGRGKFSENNQTFGDEEFSKRSKNNQYPGNQQGLNDVQYHGFDQRLGGNQRNQPPYGNHNFNFGQRSVNHQNFNQRQVDFSKSNQEFNSINARGGFNINNMNSWCGPNEPGPRNDFSNNHFQGRNQDNFNQRAGSWLDDRQRNEQFNSISSGNFYSPSDGGYNNFNNDNQVPRNPNIDQNLSGLVGSILAKLGNISDASGILASIDSQKNNSENQRLSACDIYKNEINEKQEFIENVPEVFEYDNKHKSSGDSVPELVEYNNQTRENQFTNKLLESDYEWKPEVFDYSANVETELKFDVTDYNHGLDSGPKTFDYCHGVTATNGKTIDYGHGVKFRQKSSHFDRGYRMDKYDNEIEVIDVEMEHMSERDRIKDRDWLNRDRLRDRDRARDRDRDWDRDRTRDRDRERFRDRERDWERERRRDRERDSDLNYERMRPRERNRDLDSERDSMVSNHKTEILPIPKLMTCPVELDKRITADSKPEGVPFMRNSRDNITKCSQNSLSSNAPSVFIEDLINNPGRKIRPHKIVFILRGISGSGKSYLAKLIKEREVEMEGTAPRILSIDDYFMVESDVLAKDDVDFKKKMLKYEYEAEMESSYHAALIKTFKKTVQDGFFSFIIVDNVNSSAKDIEDMWNYAKSKGFQVYVAEMDNDVPICSKRTVHGRSEADLEKQATRMERLPPYILRLDVRSLLQEAAIDEVEMEDADPDEKETPVTDQQVVEDTSKDEEDPEISTFLKSKWDDLENSEQKLDRLDGLKKKKPAARTIEEFLYEDADVENNQPKKGKRIRWADIEERREQEKMRAIGFVVGKTDWNRMTDPTFGESALTRTKYI